MKDETYKKVYIRSADDLPKEDGNYIAHDKVSNATYPYCKFNNNEGSKFWLQCIDWYLHPIEPLPVPVTDEMIKEWAELSCNYTLPPDERKVLIFQRIVGAKAMRDNKINLISKRDEKI